MSTPRRFSASSFAAGVITASALAALPAAALVARATDQSPREYDGTAPALTLKPTRFVVGSSIDRAEPVATDDSCTARSWNNVVPLELRWKGSDDISGLSSYDVWFNGPGELGKVVEGTSATSFAFTGTGYDGTCGGGMDSEGWYWVSAHDNRGNSANTSGRTRYVAVWQETGEDAYGQPGLTVRRRGTWSVGNCDCFNNGHTLATRERGASLRYTFTTHRPGQTVAVVAEENSNRGVMRIRLDDLQAAEVDTRASTPTHRVIVWQKVVAEPGEHTLRITNERTSGRPRIDVDAIMLTNGDSAPVPELDDVAAE